MTHRKVITLGLVLLSWTLVAQVPISTGSYTQDFGGADVSSWVNNSTYAGWYQNQASLAGHVNVSGAAPVNSGGFYTYECNGANDQKIGSRGSGSATLVRYGVVLRNQTGMPIHSIRVSYRGYQMSLAQNGSNLNTTTFDYVTSSSVPAITAAATTSVPALNFNQLQNSSVSGANQINGYPCTQSIAISACISLVAPLLNGNYILLRWNDVDNAANDPHMAIDDVQVDFDLTGNGCSVLLPIELVDFDATEEGEAVRLSWTTASERDNDHFVVERSGDGLAFEQVAIVPGAGTSTQRLDYGTLDPWPLKGISYYRLRQVDHDGTSSASRMVSVRFDGAKDLVTITPSITEDGQVTVRVHDALLGGEFIIVDASGRAVGSGRITDASFPLDLGAQRAGCYVLRVASNISTATAKLCIARP